jgi:Coenzyme PQQ synthesis protein D (PqqD)
VSRARLDETWAHSARMVDRKIGDARVLVPLAGRGADLDSIFNLNRVAAFIWEHVDGTRTGHAIVDAVVARFDVEREQGEADTLELLDTLLELGAIERVLPGGR